MYIWNSQIIKHFMPKTKPQESVIQDWVTTLPFMQQALLMTATRGPDNAPKCCSVKPIIHFIRGTVMKPAWGNPDHVPFSWDGFMTNDYSLFPQKADSFFADTDIYPMHFLVHLFHAAEVIAYNHPDPDISLHWMNFYHYACKGLHMTPETKQSLFKLLHS